MRYALPALLLTLLASNAQAWWGHGRYYYGTPAWGYRVPVYYAPVYYPAPIWYYAMPAESCPPVAMATPKVKAMEAPARMPEKAPPPKSSGTVPETPFSPIVPATGSTPAEEKPESKLPKIDLPTTPKLDPPKIELPKPEALEVPKLNVPAPNLHLPPLPEPKLEKSTSKFRSATKAEMFGVDGTVPPDGRYRVNFFNYTDHDVALTVNGAAVTLPAKSTTAATVSKSFKWKLDDESEADGAIPDGAAGAEVVIK